MDPETPRWALLRDLAAELGVEWPRDHGPPPAPTIADYLPQVRAASTPATVRSYDGYWTRAAAYFADRRIDDLVASDIRAFHQHIIRQAQRRNPSREGRGAGEAALRAVRAVFRLAVADGLLPAGANPAAAVPLPRRLRGTRQGLTSAEIGEINEAVLGGGDDIALDALLVRLHLETACRRGGALALRRRDLDTTYCRVLLREKGGTVRWQPISPTLTAALNTHATQRGATAPNDSLLRYADHRPLTARRYDTLWHRVRTALPWAGQLGVSAHWLRHTTLTWVERHFGYAVAHSYAGHSHDKGTTLVYTRGVPREVAAALAALTGEPHPLARP